jgi:hypothetical protein
VLGLELPPADGGEAIEAGAPIVFAEAPLGGDPALLLHAMERGIERAFFHAEDVIGDALNVQRYSPTVHGLLFKAFEDKKRQGSLEGIALCADHFIYLL